MKILVQRHRSFIFPLLVILVFSAAGAASWKYIQDLRIQQERRIDDLSADRKRLQEDYRLLLAENRRVEQKVDMLQQNGEVDARAYAKVSEYLKTLQKEIVDLTEEVGFYRGIVAESSKGSVNIKFFSLKAGGDAGSLMFQLVLTRGARSDKVARGTVNLAIEGVSKGRKVRLETKDLGLREAPVLNYQFKYFQRLEGQISIPDNFSPQRIIVTVTAAGNSSRPLRKSFDWAAINS